MGEMEEEFVASHIELHGILGREPSMEEVEGYAFREEAPSGVLKSYLPKNYLDTTISEDNPHRKPRKFGEGSTAEGPDEVVGK